MGIPCIVSKATNVGQYILRFNAGRPIENGSSLQLQKACEELCNLKQENNLSNLGQNGVRMVREAFNWNFILNEFEKLYNCA
jgi:glycosyltransferase involved in cell wall biosynthesis